MRNVWYGVKIYIEDEERRYALLVEHIKPFKEEHHNLIKHYHFFRYTSRNDRYIRFRIYGNEENINDLQQEFEKDLDQLIGNIIIRYEREPYYGEELDTLFQYGSDAFFLINDYCLRFPNDQRFIQYFQKVQRLMHLFFNPLNFDYFMENIACAEKIFGNIVLMDENKEIGSREATQDMLNDFQTRVELILNHFRDRGYEVQGFTHNE